MARTATALRAIATALADILPDGAIVRRTADSGPSADGPAVWARHEGREVAVDRLGRLWAVWTPGGLYATADDPDTATARALEALCRPEPA